jgi:hypothetical protein
MAANVDLSISLFDFQNYNFPGVGIGLCRRAGCGTVPGGRVDCSLVHSPESMLEKLNNSMALIRQEFLLKYQEIDARIHAIAEDPALDLSTRTSSLGWLNKAAVNAILRLICLLLIRSLWFLLLCSCS